MADSSEGLQEWDRINCARFISDSSTTISSLVAIKDISADEAPGDPIVFPPVNHENLHTSTNLIHHCIPQNDIKSSFSSIFPPPPSESSSSSSRSQISIENDDSSYSFPPSEFQLSEPESSPPHSPRSPAKSTFGSACLWNFGLKVLLSKFKGFEQHFQCISTVPETIASFISPLGRSTLPAIVVMFLYFRWRRRLNRSGGSREQLIRIIKQKDERINQLVNQIAEMNKLLLALHRGHNLSNP